MDDVVFQIGEAFDAHEVADHRTKGNRNRPECHTNCHGDHHYSERANGPSGRQLAGGGDRHSEVKAGLRARGDRRRRGGEFLRHNLDKVGYAWPPA